MPLMEDQQRAFDEIIGYFKSGAKRVRLLGSAGTGKTVLASELVKFIREDKNINPHYNNGAVFVTAPTNKALAVLKGKVQDDRFVYKTTHSALRMKLVTDKKSGQRSFIRTKRYFNSQEEDFDTCKFAVIDEASMIPSIIEGNTEPGLIEKNGQTIINPNYIEGHLSNINVPILYLGKHRCRV